MRALLDGGKIVYVGRLIHLPYRFPLPANPEKVIGIIREIYICALFVYKSLV